MGATPRFWAAVKNVGITIPNTAITDPINIWIKITVSAISNASSRKFYGISLGSSVSAIHWFIPVAIPTRPIATAAVRKTMT